MKSSPDSRQSLSVMLMRNRNPDSSSPDSRENFCKACFPLRPHTPTGKGVMHFAKRKCIYTALKDEMLN